VWYNGIFGSIAAGLDTPTLRNAKKCKNVRKSLDKIPGVWYNKNSGVKASVSEPRGKKSVNPFTEGLHLEVSSG
jgi:hypothetical protein